METTLQRLSVSRITKFRSVPNPRGTEASGEAGIDGACPSLHLADVPLIDIEIPQKGNARHDVKGNSPIGPLNDVLVLGTGHHGQVNIDQQASGYIPFGADSATQLRHVREIRIGEPHQVSDVPLKAQDDR